MNVSIIGQMDNKLFKFEFTTQHIFNSPEYDNNTKAYKKCIYDEFAVISIILLTACNEDIHTNVKQLLLDMLSKHSTLDNGRYINFANVDGVCRGNGYNVCFDGHTCTDCNGRFMARNDPCMATLRHLTYLYGWNGGPCTLNDNADIFIYGKINFVPTLQNYYYKVKLLDFCENVLKWENLVDIDIHICTFIQDNWYASYKEKHLLSTLDVLKDYVSGRKNMKIFACKIEINSSYTFKQGWERHVLDIFRKTPLVGNETYYMILIGKLCIHDDQNKLQQLEAKIDKIVKINEELQIANGSLMQMVASLQIESDAKTSMIKQLLETR